MSAKAKPICSSLSSPCHDTYTVYVNRICMKRKKQISNPSLYVKARYKHFELPHPLHILCTSYSELPSNIVTRVGTHLNVRGYDLSLLAERIKNFELTASICRGPGPWYPRCGSLHYTDPKEYRPKIKTKQNI